VALLNMQVKDSQNVVHTHDVILSSLKKEVSSDICYHN
jgi:hypothetical protein